MRNPDPDPHLLDLVTLHDRFIRERTYLDNVSPKTIQFYKGSFKAFRRCSPRPDAVDMPTLNEFVVNLRASGVRATTANTYIRGVNCFLTWLHRDAAVLDSRIAIKQLRVAATIPPVLSPAMLARLVRYSPPNRSQRRVHTIAMTILDTGLRVNEVVTLRVSDVDMDSMTLRVMGKGSKERIVPFSIELRRVLYRWSRVAPSEKMTTFSVGRVRNTGVFFFQNRDGDVLKYRNLLRDYGLMLDNVSIPRDAVGGFHRLRHTFATAFVREDGNAFHLMRILGHSNIRTTMVYVHSNVDDLRSRVSLLQIRG